MYSWSFNCLRLRLSTKFLKCSKNKIKLNNVAFFAIQCDTSIFLKYIFLMVRILFLSFDMWYDWYSTWLCPLSVSPEIYQIFRKSKMNHRVEFFRRVVVGQTSKNYYVELEILYKHVSKIKFYCVFIITKLVVYWYK